MTEFRLSSDFTPAGDQPEAIAALTAALKGGSTHQTLLGVTGSGKTFTLANVAAAVQRPMLVISHNKTLAAQLYSEFKHFFPDNAAGFFISYYDYYLPEAYLPQTDTYIAKDSHINEDIEKLRLAAAASILSRRDVIIVASVSCIYGLGSPEDFAEMSVHVRTGEDQDREGILRALVNLQYQRNDLAPRRGTFRVTGDTIDIMPAGSDDLVRIEFWGDEIQEISRRDPLNYTVIEELTETRIFPARHFMMPAERLERAEAAITKEMLEQVRHFERSGRLVEAQRIHQRTMYDLEMMRELGYCSGIENYSRHLSEREPGSRPWCLLDYFPDDFITVIDESHASIPQLNAMYNADRSRKEVLVEHGFRLPSALDNRPLMFSEFETVIGQRIYVSATPGAYELERTDPVRQVIRPTGLLDPVVVMRPLEGQVDDLIAEIRDCAELKERVLVTTLTKRTAEDLAGYLADIDIRVKYLHSEIDPVERIDILRDLRAGEFDCLVGVNLLREGLDLPEVSLVAILDADKEGFLRSERALIQTAGRASRNIKGRVILYADKVTDSMATMIRLTKERRELQEVYNREHDITPRTVTRPVQASLRATEPEPAKTEELVTRELADDGDRSALIRELEFEMHEAADKLEFERAALLRDQILKVEKSALDE